MDRRFLLLEFFDALSFHENAHTCVGFTYSQAGSLRGIEYILGKLQLHY